MSPKCIIFFVVSISARQEKKKCVMHELYMTAAFSTFIWNTFCYDKISASYSRDTRRNALLYGFLYFYPILTKFRILLYYYNIIRNLQSHSSWASISDSGFLSSVLWEVDWRSEFNILCSELRMRRKRPQSFAISVSRNLFKRSWWALFLRADITHLFYGCRTAECASHFRS